MAIKENNNNKTLDEREDIRNVDLDNLKFYLKSIKQPAFRAKQIQEWLWQNNAFTFDEMTNLPKALREKMSEDFKLQYPTALVKQESQDGSRKYLLEMEDGVSVETVGIPHDNKLTVCASTQAGCAMKCEFCATGKNGIKRSLSALEIYGQVMFIQRDFEQPVTNVVFMGQGEPFNNYNEVMKALRLLNKEDGANIGARRLTVSTCGIIPGIHKFTKEPEQFTLAISLHTADQKTRNALMPGVKMWSLERLYEAMQEYTEKTGRRPTYEYAMIKDVNDTDEQLAALRDFCAGTLCHVNLITLNQVKGSPFKPSNKETVDKFVKTLHKYGVETTVRNSRGSDIDAACGQLKQSFLDEE